MLMRQAYKKNQLLLLLIIIVTLAIRLPGMMWGVRIFERPHFLYYHADELNLSKMAKEFTGGGTDNHAFYPKGYPFQVALCALPLKSFVELGDPELIFIGRMISIFYSISTVFLFFFLVRRVFQDTEIALVSCAILSLVGSYVTQSHFATTDSGVLFWLYATIYFSFLSLEPASAFKNFIFAILSCGVALAFKLSFVAIIPIIYVLIKKKSRWWWYLLLPLGLFIIFELANGGKYTFTNFILTLKNVTEDNINSRNYNRFLNPLLYLFVLVPCLGLPICFLSLYGGIKFSFTKIKFSKTSVKTFLFIFILPVLIHFLSICCLSGLAERLILPLVPLIAIFAAIGIREIKKWNLFINNNRFAYLVLALAIYQLIFIWQTEYYFVHDTRESASRWIYTNIPPREKIYLPYYSEMPDLSNKYNIVNNSSASYIVLHEANYRRYFRSNFDTALRSWNQIHRPSLNDYELMRDIFKKKSPYILIKKIEVKAITPEKMFIKKFYGTPWPLGDVLVYQKLGKI